MKEILSNYEYAIALLTKQINRLKEELKANPDSVVVAYHLRILRDIRRENKEILRYLGGYYEKKYAYGHNKAFTDFYQCCFTSGKTFQSWDFSRQAAPDKGAEDES